MYQCGRGVARSGKEAAKWLTMAACQGYAEAQYCLGALFIEGFGVAQSYKEAARWFKEAADQGHAEAQRSLGIIYKEGCGLP